MIELNRIKSKNKRKENIKSRKLDITGYYNMEEIIINLKNLVEEKKNLNGQINTIEEVRNKLAKERNEKKAKNKIDNDEEVWEEINCIGRQISDLGNQSQWFQSQIDSKVIEVKNQSYIEIDSLIAEEMRKVRIINEQIEENENCIDDMNTISELSQNVEKIQEQVSTLLGLKKKIRHGQFAEVIESSKESTEKAEEVVEKTKNEEIIPEIEELKVEEYNPVLDEIDVAEFEPTIDELKVDEFKPIIDEFKVEEFEPAFDEIKLDEILNIEEPKIEELHVEEFREPIVQEDAKENEQINKLEEDIIKALEEQLAKEKQEQQEQQEKEIITFEENNKTNGITNIEQEFIVIENIVVKFENQKLVYKAQINDGTTIKIKPLQEKIFSNEKNIRKQIEQNLIGYAASGYRNFEKGTIKKMDPTICEILERFAQKYNQDAQNLVYNYVMSFSKYEECDINMVPQITYNLSYIDQSCLSKNNIRTIERIARNANKNSRVETIGTISTIDKVKYFIKKVFNINTIKALPIGNKE